MYEQGVGRAHQIVQHAADASVGGDSRAYLWFGLAFVGFWVVLLALLGLFQLFN